VSEHCILGTEHLAEILNWVIRMHGDVSYGRASVPELGALMQDERFHSLQARVNYEAVDLLADNLQHIALVHVSNDVSALAQIMVEIAIYVNYYGQVVLEEPGEPGQSSTLTQGICQEFTIACALAFAQYCDFPVTDVPHARACAALSAKDRDELARIFEDALHAARIEANRHGAESELEESADAMIQYLERKFAEASPIPGPGADIGGSQFQESYWNLQSAAAQERWSTRDVVALLEEYFRPELNPQLAGFRRVVSADDWRSLYNWINRDNGRMLWPSKPESSRQLSQRSWAPRRSPLWICTRSPGKLASEKSAR
jgi:hypothetical protein